MKTNRTGIYRRISRDVLVRIGAVAVLVIMLSMSLLPGAAAASPAPAPAAPAATIGGVNLGNLTDYLFFFANGSTDANWQGATKGFVGDVAVDGLQAAERTSGGVPYAGTIYTNDSTLGAWASIVDQNDPAQVSPAQAFGVTGQAARITGLESDLNNAFAQINGLTATPGYTNVSATSLNGLNTQNGIAQTFVINIRSGLGFSSKINITGDASDVFILRWDTDGDPTNGYQGQVKPQSGGGIVPLGGLKPSNFINVAGDINSSGGGSNPTPPYPQGPRYADGTGALIVNGANFAGGGFFTGYWLTTGSPTSGDTAPLSNAIFVGGWYTLSDKFSMTSGTSGVHVGPNTTPPPVGTCVTLQPDATAGKDAYIKQENATENRGDDSELRVKSATDNKLKHSLLQFDLSGLPSNAAITSATMSLFVKSANGGAVTVKAHQVTRLWDEGTVTWNSATASQLWAIPGGDYSAVIKSISVDDTANIWREWDVTSAASAWVNDPASNYGVILEASEATTAEKVFKSSDDGTAAEHPKLLVCYDVYTPDLQVTKTLITQGPIYVGQDLSYTINLTNLGETTLSFLPLRDWYDPAILQYLSATPAPNVALNGALTWYDLSTTLGGLAPGQSASVTVNFRALAPTTTSPLPPLAAAALSDAGTKTANATRLTAAQEAQFANALAPDGATASTLDTCGYPYASANPLTSIIFNESTVLKGFYPVDGGSAYTGQTLKVWYSDEHALTLGVRQVQIKNGSTTNYPVTAMAKNPDSALTPQVGTTALTGAQAGTDVSGRPMWPAIFITDLTGNPNNRAGDWQFGGPAIGPHAVFGTWKAAVRFVDNGTNPPTVAITPDVDPAKNDWSLDLGDPVPPGLASEGYGSEVRWDLNRLVTENGLIPGHTYRFQFMVHDGDQNKTGGDVGEACTTITFAAAASIGDRVWYDANYDKAQQTSEPGLNGVTVNLFNNACPTTGQPTGAPLATQVTTGDGFYDFGNLAAGAYCVAVDATTLPAGMALTTANEPLTVNLATNQNYNDADFGYAAECTEGTANLATVSGAMDSYDTVLTDRLGFACTQIRSVGNGAIGDFVWYDANANGIEDVGEPGIANVTLDLYQNNLKVASTVTDADGGYMFHDLPPGSYTVDVTDVNGVLTGMTHIVAYQSQPDPNGPISLTAGEVYKDSDFGYVKQPGANAIIGDTVWYDANADGFQQPGEAGIPGIQVCATPVGGGGAICATTDPAGHYLIQAPAGSYNVGPTNPPGGYTLTNPPAPVSVTVAAGEQYLNADFGYDSPNLGVIGNLVFQDANKNSVFDGGDSPLGGVSVDLIRDTNGDGAWEAGEPIIATVTTATALGANNGNYLFTAVPAGNYLVHVSDTNGVLYDFTKSALGAAGVDGNNQTDPYPVSIPDGGSNLTADFGYYPNGGGGTGSPTGIIGNQVWIEKDGNGLFDPANGDFGQPGVTVELLKDGVHYATTTSGPSGNYAFLGLPAGNYSVQVIDDLNVLAGYRVTKLGPNPGQDNNNQAQPYTVVFADDHGRNLTADFGYTQPGAIGDYVWYDSNANQIQDVGEPGIGNVTLRLYRDNGDNVLNTGTDTLVGTKITDSDGGYLFTGLIPGVYFVDVDQTSAALAGMTHMSGLQNQPDPFGPFVLTAGQIYRDADFGYFKQPAPGKAIIGDTVWYDANGDGLREPGEPGIAGIQVCATPATPTSGGAICATTDLNGVYLIEVPAGSYNVAPTNPPAGATATTPVPYGPLTVNAGDQFLDADFGYNSPNLLSLGGTVWNDLSKDGVLVGGEPGIPGVSVDLIRDNGNGVWDPGEPIIATTTTDQAGNYTFAGLPAGSYLVVVSDTQDVLDDFVVTLPGPNPGQDNNNQTQPYPVTLSNAINTTADFGYAQSGITGRLGVIGNQVWYESDGNGIYNPGTGDLGVAGVTVALYRNGQPYDTTTTGAGGDYVFTSLPAGTYAVRVTDTFGVLSELTLTILGPNPGQDNNNQAQPYAIALANAALNMTADFGYTRPGAIGDFVWYDTNANGIEDVGEPGIANVTLDLYRGGVKVASIVTDADGGYLFPDLPPGSYTVDVTDLNLKLTGMVHIVGNQSQPDPTAAISLGAGEVYKDADFGYLKQPGAGKALIGDTVWYDANADGFQQPGEAGIPGIQVCATPVGGGTPFCATTDGTGMYLIEAPAGSYNVGPTNPPGGYTLTNPPAPLPVTVVVGQQYLTADFGYDSNSLLGTIGNLVFFDANKNGVFEVGDTALGGVSVDLIRDSNGNKSWDPGELIIATVTTATALDANNGNYLFGAVPAGNYLVHVSDTNGVLTDFTKTPLGTAGADGNNQVDPYPVSIADGGSNLTADFGYWQMRRPNTGVIGNQVWIEKDGNGLFNPATGDFGQPGVTVELLKDGQPYDKTTTGASGDYAFSGLPNGNYTVQVKDDFGVLTLYTVTALGPTPGLDNNNQAQPYAVALPVSGYNLTADFGYLVPTSSIGDTVYYDDNRNGIQDLNPTNDPNLPPNEDGISGVTLQLFKDNGGGVCNLLVGTTSTDGNGKYIFTNLPPAHYCVVVPQDNPFIAGMTLTGGVNPYAVNLANNQNDPNADFGYAGTGVIKGIVYLDLNGDGHQGPNEPGIPNVKVCLKPANSTTEVCTTTSSDGTYVFSSQLAGVYAMTQTLPQGMTNTTPLTIGTTLIVSQGAGLSDNNNFGDNVTGSYSLTKELYNTASPVAVGQKIMFKITVHNSGTSWISVLPLTDTYNTAFLTYGFGGDFATPNTDDNTNDGVLNWTDLTAAAPNGFGMDLEPGKDFVVYVTFTARGDTSTLPSHEVVNYVTVPNTAKADPDGPNGALGSIISLPEGTANAPVVIYAPTGVTLEAFDATVDGDGVVVNWRSASENEILGYNLLRQADGAADFITANPELIVAENAGQDRGAAYTFRDAGLPPSVYTYVLEFIKLDGTTERSGTVQVTVGP